MQYCIGLEALCKHHGMFFDILDLLAIDLAINRFYLLIYITFYTIYKMYNIFIFLFILCRIAYCHL